jgi:16S rRNA (cytosine967-C5)-methyltransferase
MKEQPLHPNLAEAIVEALRRVFEERRYADKVVESILKSNPRWGSRDRRLIAETTYDIVRWWRLIRESANLPSFEGHYAETLTAWLLLNHQPVLHRLPKLDLSEEEMQTRRERLEENPAVRESIPDWLAALLHAEIGEAWVDEMSAMNRQAAVVLRVNTLKTNLKSLQRKLHDDGIDTNPLSEFPDALLLERRSNVFQLSSFKEGLFEVQDAGSQAIAPFLKPEPGMRVVDVCAGAGGKTLHVAALMENRGHVIAMDVEEWKLIETRKRARRAGVGIVETRLIDSTKVIKRLHGTADRVLIDAPCSGLGVLRRNPDAKWKLSPETIEKVKNLQADLLQRYALMAKSGGKIVYATCSILPSENEKQVERFLLNNKGHYELEDQRSIMPSEGFDGFYMARIKRIAAVPQS